MVYSCKNPFLWTIRFCEISSTQLSFDQTFGGEIARIYHHLASDTCEGSYWCDTGAGREWKFANSVATRISPRTPWEANKCIFKRSILHSLLNHDNVRSRSSKSNTVLEQTSFGRYCVNISVISSSKSGWSLILLKKCENRPGYDGTLGTWTCFSWSAHSLKHQTSKTIQTWEFRGKSTPKRNLIINPCIANIAITHLER